jgi:CRP/FNR family transcriptional regulator
MSTICEQKPKTSCENCRSKQNGFLCHLTPNAAKEFESLRVSSHYPAGSTLFFENETPRGIFVVCSGQVKLSVSSKGGKTLIQQIVKPGEIIGVSASISGTAYEVTAETLYPAEVAFIRRDDFLRFARQFPEVYWAITCQLNLQYERACEQLRIIGLSTTAHEKLARLFLHWSEGEMQTTGQNQIRVPYTHEQIAACLGSTRETVTRTLNDFKNKHLVTLRGSMVMIPDRSALLAVCGD